MTRRPGWLQRDNNDLIIWLVIQPRASKDEVVGSHGESAQEEHDCADSTSGPRLKIRITAPPVDGKANSHLIKFLSKSLRIPKSQFVIESGETGRNKRVRIKAADEKIEACFMLYA